MALRSPHESLPPGGSDVWDNGPAGALLSAETFDAAASGGSASGTFAGAWSVRNAAAGTLVGAWSVRNQATGGYGGEWSFAGLSSASGSFTGAWSIEQAVNAVLGGGSRRGKAREFDLPDWPQGEDERVAIQRIAQMIGAVIASGALEEA